MRSCSRSRGRVIGLQFFKRSDGLFLGGGGGKRVIRPRL